MKVVIAPDTFKESLPAAKVAAAIAEGVLAVVPKAVVDLCPMADGGDGTVDAMVAATNGQILTADVFGPMGQPLRARFGLLGSLKTPGLPGELGLSAARLSAEGHGPAGGTAVIEMAAASGLALVPLDKRDPRRATTFGTGQLIMAALDAGARQIIVGIGGSATVDGGAGCAQALGVTFINRDGQIAVCGLGGGGLADIADFDVSGIDPRLAQASIRVACDVTNPMLGAQGAAAVFGPQKGATPDMVAELEAGLANLAGLIRGKLGLDVASMPGSGAAGGLGAGLVAFAGAKMEGGLKMVAQAVGLDKRLRGADLCITGEGRLDGQSRSGKTCVGVAAFAAAAGVPIICIPGQAADDAPRELFAMLCPLVQDNVTPNHAMRRTGELLKLRASQAMLSFLARR